MQRRRGSSVVDVSVTSITLYLFNCGLNHRWNTLRWWELPQVASRLPEPATSQPTGLRLSRNLTWNRINDISGRNLSLKLDVKRKEEIEGKRKKNHCQRDVFSFYHYEIIRWQLLNCDMRKKRKKKPNKILGGLWSGWKKGRWDGNNMIEVCIGGARICVC